MTNAILMIAEFWLSLCGHGRTHGVLVCCATTQKVDLHQERWDLLTNQLREWILIKDLVEL